MLKSQGRLIGNQIVMEFEVGNTYWHISNPHYCKDGTPNEHGWVMFFRAKDQLAKNVLPNLVKLVKFKLHHTAKNPNRIVNNKDRVGNSF